MLGKEAQVVLDTFSQLMAMIMEEPILHIEGLFNSQITIVVLRLYSWKLCGEWVPSTLCKQDLYC